MKNSMQAETRPTTDYTLAEWIDAAD
jgi:hypothetical protein